MRLCRDTPAGGRWWRQSAWPPPLIFSAETGEQGKSDWLPCQMEGCGEAPVSMALPSV
ncbi:hypothetical protein IF1G_03898 [Cordyceps javanica]|uniref:Uncharacterized protein n=1 Tax=Cordyceps javanica TaxID=43265 RepID=A0A545V8W7_9HYPO|nr:hypothetical protein IF1G_03898 [Cordyceps javanica]